MGAFDGLTARNLYGVPQSMPQRATSDVSPGIAMVAGPRPDDPGQSSLLSPQHPLFVFGLLLAAAYGLVGIAGSARLGPAGASINLGKS